MPVRYFVFLYPENRQIQELLDLAIYVLNPAEKWQAHITLAGPYNTARTLPRRLEFVRKVSLLGAGQFRSEYQNTVFLSVGAQDLRDFWHKPDYPFNPHLTVYNGDDSVLADRLYETLFEARMYFKFFVSRVHIVKAIKGQETLDLVSSLNLGALPELKNLTIQDIRQFSADQRILYAAEALKRAKYESSKL